MRMVKLLIVVAIVVLVMMGVVMHCANKTSQATIERIDHKIEMAGGR